ncbi:MAG TPA: DUF362 domain-containing protein [Polyangiales bacterium]|nr:DUF362 domain-containing protein [Polyangiales bacterium]
MAYDRKFSRRNFLATGSTLALGPLVLQLASCASHSDVGKDDGPAKREPTPTRTLEASSVLLGLYAGDGAKALEHAVKRLDFSWLGKGDSVLIKVASNSGNPHPAVTSPAGARAMAAHLKALGAGRVVVADQAGVEHVRLSAQGRFSSTRERWMQNGLMAVVQGDAELHFFDDQGFEDGYFEAAPPDDNHWPRGLRIANAVLDADHVVYMPRIGAHTLAGLTLGHKSAIGFLRDDSRHDLHNDAANFYEKYTEINYTRELRERFRMAVTVAPKLLLHGGPDVGTVYDMAPVLVVASDSLANHDALAASLLVSLQNGVLRTGGAMDYNAAFAPLANRAFAGGFGVATGAAGAWRSAAPSSSYSAHAFEQGVTKDRAIARGWELSGGKPSRIEIVSDGKPLDENLHRAIEAHGEGLYAFA